MSLRGFPSFLFLVFALVLVTGGPIRLAAMTSSPVASPRAAGERLVKSPEELEAAIASAIPGDQIIMQAGEWKDVDIVFKAAGTADHPIILKAQPHVLISGSSSLQIGGEYLIVDGLHFKNGASSRPLHLIEFKVGRVWANNCRITNIVVSEFNKDRDRPDSKDVWVGLFGSNNRIDHCLFQGKTSESVLIIVWRSTADPNYHRIDHNYFREIPSIGLGGATAIRIGDGTHALSSSHTTVEENIFENMLGIGKIINIKSGGNIIRNNTFIKASGSIAIRQGNGNLIEGNYILPGLRDAYTGGIRVIGENHVIRNNYIHGTRERGKAAIVLYEGEMNNHPGKGGYYPTKNIIIANNTLIDNDKNFIIGMYYKSSPELTVPVENVLFEENVVLGNGSEIPIVTILDKPIGEFEFRGNRFFNGDFSGIENVQGITKAEPELAPGKDGIYTYSSNSAFRKNIIKPPLKRTDVGPSWLKKYWAYYGIEDSPYIEHAP